MPTKLGICGVGQHARSFVPLFKRHPQVSQITLCDIDSQRLRSESERYGIAKTCPSLDALCQSDVDAIGIFTQNDRHAPQAIQALRAGKDVYSAVPSAISVQEIDDLVRAVESTGKIYMIGETSYYYPCAIYCRDRFRKGDFGQVVYSEAEYYHDFAHGLDKVYQTRFGDDWKRQAAIPPFFYPTHSTSMIISTTAAYAQQVCGMGVVYKVPPGGVDFHNEPNPICQNPFSNETMLCRMSDGSVSRINEFRRVGYSGRPGQVGIRLYGTVASFESQVGNSMWVTLHESENRDLTQLLACAPSASHDPAEIARAASQGVGAETFSGVSAVHPVADLPKEFRGMPNGHVGAHQFLVHEFVTACVDRLHPRNNVWQAARYLLPGLTAHESALQGGKLMEVPDLGDGRAAGRSFMA